MTRGELDPTVVRRHLAALREALDRLSRHRGRTADELRGDADLRWLVERGLQLCAQNVLDIATHIAATAGLDAPDYASAIDRLGELSVLSVDEAARLRGIAGFRNVLVHGYLQTDPRIVEEVLGGRLSELARFAEHVERYLERTGG